MKGLDQVHYDLDSCRRRVVRLTEMERLPAPIGSRLVDDILAIQNKVEALCELEEQLEAKAQAQRFPKGIEEQVQGTQVQETQEDSVDG